MIRKKKITTQLREKIVKILLLQKNRRGVTYTHTETSMILVERDFHNHIEVVVVVVETTPHSNFPEGPWREPRLPPNGVHSLLGSSRRLGYTLISN